MNVMIVVPRNISRIYSVIVLRTNSINSLRVIVTCSFIYFKYLPQMCKHTLFQQIVQTHHKQ